MERALVSAAGAGNSLAPALERSAGLGLTQRRSDAGAPVAPPPRAAAPRMTPSWLATQGRLPLAFMGLGVVWFAVAAAAVACAPEWLALPQMAPPLVALTHAWILGFFVTIAVGAMYQLAPVALATTLWSERTGWWHLALHASAVPVLVYGFWTWNFTLLGVAGTTLLAGALVFAVNVIATVLGSGKRDAVAWSLVLATGWFVLTVGAGLFLIANKVWGLWPTDPLRLLRAHAHLGLVGFFLTLLQGVTFRLVPMFTLGDVPNWRPVRAGLWLSQLGLVALAPALAWHLSLIAVAAATAIFAGMVLSGWALYRTFGTRKKRRLDSGVQALVRGAAGLIFATLLGGWMLWPTTAAGSMPGGLSAVVYGLVLLAGGLLPAIAGMMGKIVPFLTWMRAYGPKVGRQPTPPATALANARLESWALILQAASLLPLIAGAWLLDVTWLRIGGIVLAVGAGLFVANMIIVLRHLWRPVKAPLATKVSHP
jgi:hypothetical protein